MIHPLFRASERAYRRAGLRKWKIILVFVAAAAFILFGFWREASEAPIESAKREAKAAR